MIQAEDLSKQFDQFWAVNGVDLNVAPGRVLVLLGPNGAGKTTTVRMLTSILRPTRGQARLAGYDVIREADRVRASVGVLTEHHGLYGRMNAQEYLEFYAGLYGLEPKYAAQRRTQLLEQFGLAADQHRRLGEYSKGMRQKLALVRALQHDPQVLLLDEPTSAMDPESARMVRDAIRSLRSGERTIMLCTHNLVEAEELADQVAIIRRGRIILNDTLEGIKLSLLGPAEYEVRLAGSVNGWAPAVPGVAVTGQGEDWLRLRVANPKESNPELVRQLLQNELQVVTLQEVPRSLETVYLEAVNRLNGGGRHAE